MIGYVLLGFLAAFGLVCVLWVLVGMFLPGSGRCTLILICDPKAESAILRRIIWLREMGLLRCGILLSGCGLTGQQREQLRKKYPTIEFCDPEKPGE